METLKIEKKVFEKFLQTNWTKFINPHNFITFVIHHVSKANLPIVKNNSFGKKDSLSISLSQFKPSSSGCFEIWADFYIPKKEGAMVGTCEFNLNIKSCSLEHINTVGCFNIFADKEVIE